MNGRMMIGGGVAGAGLLLLLLYAAFDVVVPKSLFWSESQRTARSEAADEVMKMSHEASAARPREREEKIEAFNASRQEFEESQMSPAEARKRRAWLKRIAQIAGIGFLIVGGSICALAASDDREERPTRKQKREATTEQPGTQQLKPSKASDAPTDAAALAAASIQDRLTGRRASKGMRKKA